MHGELDTVHTYLIIMYAYKGAKDHARNNLLHISLQDIKLVPFGIVTRII